MSQRRSRIESDVETETVTEWLADRYHVIVGAMLVGYMFWSRIQSRGNFVTADGTVLFRGNDAWYHYRQTTYTVQHWPETMPFDPWTYFPHGTTSGQFGTLFDQLVATAALIVGLGSPSPETVAMTLLVAPVVFGVATALPTFAIGRRLGGRVGGVVAVTVLALSAGAFLSRSLVGFSDHHVAETFFQTVAVLAVMVAVSVAEREKPIYEQLVDGDYDRLRPTLAWCAIAGVAIALYLWTWPPGVLLIGILGTYFLLQLSIEFLRGDSPEHTAFAGAVISVVTAVAVLPPLQFARLTATNFSLLQPALALAVGVGCAFMAWLARDWERANRSRTTYPFAVLGVIVVLALAFRLAAPGTSEYIVNNVLRVIGFTTSPTAGTVGEAQPLRDPGQLFVSYGFGSIVALLGGAVIVGRVLWAERVPAEQLLVVVWAAFMTAATFTQARFQYYLIVPVAVLTGSLVGDVVDMSMEDTPLDEIEAYQVLTIGAIVIVVLVPLLVQPVAGERVGLVQNNGPGQGIQGWDDGLQWVQENTPAVGAYNGSDPSLEYYGTYPAVEDHDYEAGEYGILSWWDYGHWITTRGERIPNANPFQQGASEAANFLLAPNETQANDVLDEMGEDDASTRYVMVDWKMVNTYSNYQGKYFAPQQFYEPRDINTGQYFGHPSAEYHRPVYISDPAGEPPHSTFQHHRQEYYESTAVRLYHYHGSAVGPEPIVVDWDNSVDRARRPVLSVNGKENPLRTFNTLAEAREYVEGNETSSVGGIGGHPSERVPALEHYRLVGASERSATTSTFYNAGAVTTGIGVDFGVRQVNDPSECGTDVYVPRRGIQDLCLTRIGKDVLVPSEPRWTKTFERVPGATVEGTGPENTTVRAVVEMDMPGSNESFEYRQAAQTGTDGEFTMTLPYSTTDYDDWGPANGHTNVSVRANGTYSFVAGTIEDGNVTSWSATADVSEAKVVGEDGTPVTVELEQVGNQTNATASPAGPGDGSTGEDGTDGGSGNGTTEARTAPTGLAG